MDRKDSYAAFTIIEVMVTMGIITVLIAVALLGINGSQQFARSQDRLTKAGEIADSVNRYLQQNGRLPSDLDGTFEFTADDVKVGLDVIELPGALSYSNTDTDFNSTNYMYIRDFGDYQICVQQESGVWDGLGSGNNLCP